MALSALWLGRWGRRLLWWSVGGASAVLVLAALAWALLLCQILPRIDTWRAELSQQATRALGVPVQIGQIVGSARGIWPELSLREVRLLDAQGRVALRLPEVTARVSPRTLSPMALWQRELVLAQLVLVAPELDVRRDNAGQIWVAGLALGSMGPGHGGATDLRAADWVMSQSRIEIARGTVRWSDAQMGAPTLALQQVDLSLRNGWGLGRRVHELTLQATPPAEFGERFEVNAHLTQALWSAGGKPVKVGQNVRWWQRFGLHPTHAGDASTWSGTVATRLPKVDVQRLRQHVHLPIDVSAGQGAVAATVRIEQGLPQGLQLDARVRDLNLRLASDLPALAFKHLNGHIELGHASELTTLAFQQLDFELDEGLVWPASSGRLDWRHAPWPGGLNDAVWGLTRGGQAQADRLDLALLARLADRLPLNPRLRATLADLQPEGVVEQLAWQWDGLLEQPTHYRATGRVHKLGWAPSDADSRPGLSQADVTVTADERGGQAELAMHAGWLAFPGVFESPQIPVDTLGARVSWTLTPPTRAGQPTALTVSAKQVDFANEDAHGQLNATWHTGEGPARFPGHLSLSGQLDRAKADRVWRYLPQAIPKDPRDYVRHALREGRSDQVAFEVEGLLDAFPFKDDQGGRFRVKVPVRQLKLDYVPVELAAGTWPGFTALDGDLVFEGQRMLIKGGKGRLGGVGSGGFNLHHVEGRIDDLGAKDPHLTIRGQGEGLLDDMLRFVSASPVGALTGNLLGQAQGSGTGAMQLALDIPLNRADATTLKGQVTLNEADAASLRLLPSLPVFAALRGSIAFTETSLTVQARTQVWGQEFSVEGRQGSQGGTRFVAQGSVSGEALRRAHEWPVLVKLGQHASGEAPVTVNVDVSRDAAGQSHQEVQVLSTLQGLAMQLPAPLNKPAQATWPLKVTHRVDDPQGLSDAILVELGSPPPLASSSPWLKVDLRRDLSTHLARLSRGVVNLVHATAGLPAPLALPLTLPLKGLAVQLQVPTLDGDAWLAAGRGMSTSTVTSVAPGNTATPPASASEGLDSYQPDTVVLKAGAVSYQGRTLKDVNATVAHPGPGVWRLQLDSQQAAGTVEWLPETSPLANSPRANRVVARLSRVSVPAAEAQSLSEQASAQLLNNEPAPVPALDVVIEQFEWRGLPLGRIEVEALNRQVPVSGGASVPEWRLTKLRISNPEAQLNATGNWTPLGAQSVNRRAGVPSRTRAAFGFTLDLHNSGELLGRLGQPQTLKGGKGSINGQVSWLGSPLEPDPATMTGDMAVLINEGQFLKADPGIAKLLGVLSLQSLPRRLALDFRDVFQQGFAFDRIDGDVKVNQGVATTRNLRMRGVQAVVLMEGQADLAHETQNLQVYVVPDVNAGGASLAYAAINPVVGLGTFVAQVLLRKQVAEASSQAFHITGAWADPVVEKVPFKAEAASAAEAAASAVTKPRKPS